VTVADVYAQSADLEDDLLGQSGFARRVGVTEHRLDRRDQSQLVKNRGATHIADVKDQLYSRQGGVNARANQPVRV
jgi:hypothetical protein